jgi:putative transposase
MSIEEKKQRIQPKHPKLSIQRQCELIGLPRSSYYREGLAGQETLKNIEIMRFIDKEYTDHPFYGTRQMRNVLIRKGYKINRKRVQRLMRKMGIQSIAPKPNTSKAHPQNKVYPYLLRNFDVTRSNQVWCTDITYIPLSGGFVYLTAVMDWHSRYVLSWELSITMDNEFCVSALERALRCYGTPYIFNTDQGSQYTSHEFTNVLKNKGIKISMDGKGRAMDNIFIERLWRSVKYEEIYVNEFQSVEPLCKALKKYFDF